MADERAKCETTKLVADHHRAVFGYALRLTGSPADAEDLTQQVFLQAYRKLEQLREPEKARAWLNAILRNAYLKSVQRSRPELAEDMGLNLGDFPDSAPPDEVAVDGEELQAALDQLNPSHRVVLVMFYYEECSYREIAERLELPIGTVMSRLARAKKQLRGTLSPSKEVDGSAEPTPKPAEQRG